MRYFARIAYNGSNYFGWQRQPKQLSVQEIIESKLSLLLTQQIDIVGCGRTDTGVHAKDYVLHFDADIETSPNLLSRINQILPEDIVFYKLARVHDDAHARFDAVSRAYQYHINCTKDPFKKQLSWYNPKFAKNDIELINEAVTILKNYSEFLPFCKSNSGAQTLSCDIRQAYWTKSGKNQESWVFYIEADRFLRGMIRLIVGMCVYVGLGKITINDLVYALDNQVPLKMPLSVPPHGLFLDEIKYTYF
jgi:tRNA pseudouridine38-40 synthase